MVILNNATSNDTSDRFRCYGNRVLVQIAGTWDGATVTLYTGQDNLPMKAHPDGVFTADDHVMVECVPGMNLEARITSAGASTSLSVSAIDQKGD